MAGDLIEEFLAELDRSLHGPRGARKSLLEEAKDGLLDATDAYRHLGVHPADAVRRALADFGTIAEVTPAFQAELDDARRQRAATTILLVLPGLITVWSLAWRANPGRLPPSTTVSAFTVMLGIVAVITTLSALVVLLLTRRDIWHDPPPWTRHVIRFGIRAGMIAFGFSAAALAATAPASVRWHPFVSTCLFAVAMLVPLKAEFHRETTEPRD